MIKRYSDHAANERTFLAWVRTAIAVMAFGFIIERFDLFVRVAAPQLAQRQLGAHGEGFANWAGLIFIIIGISLLPGCASPAPPETSTARTKWPAPASASISRLRS